MIAALYVDPKGCYSALPDVHFWCEKRDARGYVGPWPVVAHPPCTRWCRLAGLVEARWGYKRGEDGGTFAHALWAVRSFGGVLEHPAYSDAWKAFGLARPPREGGWVKADEHGGWTCHVEQWRYGHAAKKATWLYACKTELPELLWGAVSDREKIGQAQWRLPALVGRAKHTVEVGTAQGKDLISWARPYKRRPDGTREYLAVPDGRRRLGKKEASATPPAFREVLLAIARSCPHVP